MKLRDRLGKILLGLARRVAPSLFSAAPGSANLGVRCYDRWHHGFTSPKGVVVDFFDTGEIVVLVEDHTGKTHIWEERLGSPNDPKLSDCGARRAGCGKAAGAGWAKAAGWFAAASVTRGAVRCSAWFGDGRLGLRMVRWT